MAGEGPTAATDAGVAVPAVLRRRWPLFAALAFTLLFVLGQLVVPTPPQVRASGAKVVAYYQDHRQAIRLSVWLTALAGLAFVPLMAWLRQHTRGLGRDVFLLAAAAIVVETTICTWFSAGLALHPGRLAPETARTIVDVAAYYGPVLTVTVILLVAPVALASWNGANGAPRWLAWLSVALVIEQAIETVTVFGTSGFVAPGGPMNLVLGAGLFVVWVIACRGGPPDRARRPSDRRARDLPGIEPAASAAGGRDSLLHDVERGAGPEPVDLLGAERLVAEEVDRGAVGLDDLAPHGRRPAPGRRGRGR